MGSHSWALRLQLQDMSAAPPVVLTVAGFDPSSGAGVTADIKTIAAHECYGVSCITALTVQSTRGVRRLQPVASDIILETLEELIADLEVMAVHIGMLGTGGTVRALANFFRQNKLPHIVLDPILKSSSGADLLDAEGTMALIDELLPLAEVLTPNLDEAAVLASVAVTNLDEMRAAAARLHSLGAPNVVVTGGQLEKAIDLLSFTAAGKPEEEVFTAQRQRSTSTHGTGCAFATALACHLAHGRGLPEAVLLSKAYVSSAIAKAQVVGKGTGPLHHLFRMEYPRRVNPIISDPEWGRSK